MKQNVYEFTAIFFAISAAVATALALVAGSSRRVNTAEVVLFGGVAVVAAVGAVVFNRARKAVHSD